MCLGVIVRLASVDGVGGREVGVLEDGTAVSLAFVPDARPGDVLLVHLGIPVEVLPPESAEAALTLRDARPHHGGSP